MDDILKKAQDGDVEAIEYIFGKYRRYMYFLAHRYNIPDGDYEDIYQEASIGLFLAIKENKCELGYTFSNFAKKCIKNKILSVLKKYNTKQSEILKHTIHERKVNLFVDYRNPEEIVIEREKIKDILNSLSDVEYIVLILRVLGFSLCDIAKKIGYSTDGTCDVKERIKKKIIKIKNGQGHEMETKINVSNRTFASAMCKSRNKFRENKIIFSEEEVNIISNRLSDLEYNVAKLRLKGLSNSEIAKKLNKTKNSIENVIRRINIKKQK